MINYKEVVNKNSTLREVLGPAFLPILLKINPRTKLKVPVAKKADKAKESLQKA